MSSPTETSHMPTQIDTAVAQATPIAEGSSSEAGVRPKATWFRIGAFGWGCGFLALAVIDSVFDPFPANELFFGGTGTTLLIAGMTGQWPKAKS